ncbi:hypothetical protein [Nitrincola alkalilacustris]|nr:hypothetical protein [Nitrincola alkalilacustris]
MKKGPDLILILILVFIVGTVMTGFSQSGFELASLVQQVFNS